MFGQVGPCLGHHRPDWQLSELPEYLILVFAVCWRDGPGPMLPRDTSIASMVYTHGLTLEFIGCVREQGLRAQFPRPCCPAHQRRRYL